MALFDRVKRAWNVFRANEESTNSFARDYNDTGQVYYYRPDLPRMTRGNERSIVTAIYNRISMDVSAVDLMHTRLDANGRYIEEIDSGLNNCLRCEANMDQTGRAFIQDAVLSMLDEGHVALLPIDTSKDPTFTDSYDILTMRTGKVTKWSPHFVTIDVYNETKGLRQEVSVPKTSVAIVENPFYTIMNEPNSTLQRLIHKLNILDAIDEQSGAGKLDLIIQLPYVIKTDARRKQAEDRRKDIEQQLAGSKYGIAYTDGTEHITQLNRSVDNNLMSQIEYLTTMLYSQLGINASVLDGTANDSTMLNYYNRTIEPVLNALTEEMKRKFLTKTARSQHQSISFFRDPFKLVPVEKLAEIADKFTRNEIMTSNEIRQIVGMKPSTDPNADVLRNKNLSESNAQIERENIKNIGAPSEEIEVKEEEIQNE